MNSTANASKTRSTMNLLTHGLISIFAIVIVMGTASQVEATGALFYALETGEVRALDMETGGDAGISIPNTAFVGTPPTPATGRNIAYDHHTDLLWYSASDNHVHSLYVGTLAAGPTISDINDAIYGAIRTIAIDNYVHRLYISNSNGNVEVYNLLTNTKMFTIPLAAFGFSEPNPGNLRRLAADGHANLWYAAADGTFKEFVPLQANPHFTGRAIPLSAQIEPANPGQYRAFVATLWPNGDHYLYYANSLGDVQAVDLITLNNAGVSFSEPWFWTTSNPGVLRTIAIDHYWTPPGTFPGMPTGITASDGTYPDYVVVTWNPVDSADYYHVSRRVNGTTVWLSVGFPTPDPVFYDYYYVVPGEIYEYTVSASNQWGWGFWNPDTDTGYAGGLVPPTGLTASQGTFDDRVRLSWSPVSGAAGYLIVRELYGSGTPTTQWVTTTTWDDMNTLPQDSTWEYRIQACTDPSTCSTGSDPAWGWTERYIFRDGFESSDLLGWSGFVD